MKKRKAEHVQGKNLKHTYNSVREFIIRLQREPPDTLPVIKVNLL